MKKLTIVIFCLLYILVSFVSTIHIIDFFELSNSHWLSVTLGIAFEIGAAASLCSVAVLDKVNRFIVWGLFVVLTLFQIQANMWFTYNNLHDYTSWVELFWLNTADPITQKRVLSIVSGAILPIVALGFIKALVDYMKPGANVTETETESNEIPADFDFKATLSKNQSLNTVNEGELSGHIPASEWNSVSIGNKSSENTGGTQELHINSEDNTAKIKIPKDIFVRTYENDPGPGDIETLHPIVETDTEEVDPETLRNRQLADELVSETQNSQQIDKPESSSTAPLSVDNNVSRGRGMQINRS